LARGIAPPKPVVKPPPKPPGPAAKAAVDMSFFGPSAVASGSKPKPKLPDIKKVERAPASNLLMNTMRMLKPVKTDLSSSDPVSGTPVETKNVKLNKKGFTVRFRDTIPDGVLEAVKEFTRPAFEFEKPPWHVVCFAHNCRADVLGSGSSWQEFASAGYGGGKGYEDA